MNSPAKITLHKISHSSGFLTPISLPAVPGSLDALPPPPRKTTAEAWLESRRPLIAQREASGTEAQGELDGAAVLACLTQPRTAREIGDMLAVETRRASAVLRVLENRQQVAQHNRRRHGLVSLWALAGAVIDWAPPDPGKHTSVLNRERNADRMQKRRADFAKLIRQGIATADDIGARIGMDRKLVAKTLRVMLDEGALTRAKGRAVLGLRGGAMNRSEILGTAKSHITRDREATHGKPENSFATIAGLWSVLLGQAVTPAQVALMLSGLKIARAWGNPAHGDNWIDLAGYAACGGGIATASKLPDEGISVSAHIARRDAARAALQDMDPQPLEWPQTPEIAPPEGQVASGLCGLAAKDATAWQAQNTGGGANDRHFHD